MSQEATNIVRMAAVGITALGAIVAGYYGRKSEREKQKKIESEILALDGPNRSIREKLEDVVFISRSIKKEDDIQLKETEEELSDIEAKLNRIEKFAEAKLPSQEREIQDLFEKAAASLEQESKERHQDIVPGKEQEKNTKGVRSALSRAVSKFTESGHTKSSGPTNDGWMK